MRTKFKCGGRGRHSKRSKSSICTYCFRVHPRGKVQKKKAKASNWESCSAVAIRLKLSKAKH